MTTKGEMRRKLLEDLYIGIGEFLKTYDLDDYEDRDAIKYYICCKTYFLNHYIIN